jgi:ElaB/YqjD/DUF883 family membrane-anchored ribosome-binding protein
MSDKASDKASTVQGAFQATKDAVESATEQMRAAAPGVYDTGARAARYVSSTATEYPITGLLLTAGLAYLAGYLTHTGNNSWADWRDRGAAMGDRLSSDVPNSSQAVSNAGDYISHNVQEHPLSGLLGAAFLGCVLGYFLPGHSS